MPTHDNREVATPNSTAKIFDMALILSPWACVLIGYICAEKSFQHGLEASAWRNTWWYLSIFLAGVGFVTSFIGMWRFASNEKWPHALLSLAGLVFNLFAVGYFLLLAAASH